MATQFTSSSLKKSTVRVRVSAIITLQRYQLLPWIHLLCFLFNFSTATSVSSPASQSISYTDHCNSIVPESTLNGEDYNVSLSFLQFQNGYFSGGDQILGQNPNSSFDYPKTASFGIQRIYRTDIEGVLKVEGSLFFRSAYMYPFLGNFSKGRSLRSGQFRYRRPRFPIQRGGLSFSLQGFWSRSSGKLCMVGSGSGYSKEGKLLDLSAVFKLNYPENSTIRTSLVNGTLESINETDSLNYFEPISILAFSQWNYEYTVISKANVSGCSGADDGQTNSSLSLEPSGGVCSMLLRSRSVFELEYGSHCDVAKNCSPLGRSNIAFLPGFMSFSGVQCSDNHRLRLLLMFSNASYTGYNAYSQPLVPDITLVGEGTWVEEKNRLCLIACPIFNASVGDCSIRLSLRFPSIVSIRNRSSIVGQIWSDRTIKDLDYFDRIVFRNSDSRVPNLKYEYTEIDRVRSCAKKKSVKNKGKRYPDGYSSDLRFDMSVKNSQGQYAWGYSTPLYVGDRFYERHLWSASRSEYRNVSTNHISLLNISYTVSFNLPLDFKSGGGLSLNNTSSIPYTQVKISAEGIYNTETGGLCMVGCRHVPSNHWIPTKNYSMDCEIFIDAQFPSLNANGRVHVKGTIKSKRGKPDPLYFESLEFFSNSIYVSTASESIWRMDLEITMVLISNTLACIFVGLQLFYVKKHLDVLPFISLVMLVILTLGHMIPLVLNFEALFLANRNRQNVLLGSGGWLEVNEVIVRIVTMVAFLLQFRLLQLTWTTRLADGNTKGSWVAEKKALYVSLPLYLFGGLIALFVHWGKNYYGAPMLRARFISGYQRHSLWGDLRSYAGLVLDGFLLPQILLNLFLNSKEKALAPSFYVGTTAVRLLPHAYDLYRAHKYTSYFDLSYIYANPGADFYSTAWDVIIPCGGLLFAILIFLQQRCGGCCILPRRFREPAVYEKVPVVSGE